MTVIGPGARVKCIKRGKWKNSSGQTDGGPQFGLVYTVERIVWCEADGDIPEGDYLCFIAWSTRRFCSKQFIPLDGNEDLSLLTACLEKGPVDDLQRILEPVRV